MNTIVLGAGACAGTSPFEGSQTAGRKHSLTHQQKTGLKIYRAWPYPSEPYQDTPSQSLPSGSFHRLLILIHQRAVGMPSRSFMSDYLPPHGLWPTKLLCPWGISRQEYWSGLQYPSPGDLPNLGIEPRSPALSPETLPSEPSSVRGQTE